MIRFLSTADVLNVAQDILGDGAVGVRDIGLLESAVLRPQTTVFGEDAYPSLLEKAAALLHSLASNHALLDGNKRTALVSTLLFLQANGVDAGQLDEDDGLALVLEVAQGLSDVDEIAVRLRDLVHGGNVESTTR